MKRLLLFIVGFSMLCSCVKTLKPEETPIVKVNNHGAVDLGLSVMWSNCNLGASSITDYGDYYGWGKKFALSLNSNTEGPLFSDAAIANWGRPWRIPTIDEVIELLSLKHKAAVINGVKGYIFTGKNGNSIFIPYTGFVRNNNVESLGQYGNYWTTNQWDSSSEYDGDKVNTLEVSDYKATITSKNVNYRTYGEIGTFKLGLSIRPVCSYTKDNQNELTSGQEKGHPWINLGLSSGTKWATMNIGAEEEESTGDFFAWGETKPHSSNINIKWSEYKFYLSGRTSSSIVLSKYSSSERHGKVDNLFTLMKEDDAAAHNWGGNWQIPTIEQWNELITQCKWTWIENKGYKIEGPNGNKIMLPISSDTDQKLNNTTIGSYSSYTNCYWTKNLRGEVCYQAFCAVILNSRPFISREERTECYNIRPVLK